MNENKNVTTSWMVLSIFVAQLLTPFAVNTARADSYCDAFCGIIINSNGQVGNLAGTGAWSSQDASTCSSYQATAVSPAARPNPLPSPWPTTTAQQLQCQYSSNSQVVSQCEAYDAGTQASAIQKVMIPLDLAAAALCATACLSTVGGDEMQLACTASTTVASAVELMGEMSQKSSAVGKAINMTMGALGVVGGGATTAFAANSMSNYGTANLENTQVIGKSEKGSDAACYMTAFMVVMAALRAAHVGDATNTKQNACNAIESLASSASTAATTAGYNPLAGLVSSTSGATSAASTGTSQVPQAMQAGGSSNPACAAQGMGAAGCGFSNEQLSQPDVAALNSPLGQAAAPQAANAAAAMQGSSGDGSGSAGGAIGNAVGGEAGKALSDLANTVSAHAAELGASGGAIAKSGSAPAAASKGMSFDFGGGGTAAAGTASDMNFAGRTPAASTAAASSDIFHAGYKGSIFQLLSTTISTNANKVDQLDWSTPLNHALAGSTPKK